MAKKDSGRLALVKGAETSTIKLEGIDKQGRKRTAVLKAVLIGGDDEEYEGASSADEPDPFESKAFGTHKLIRPRYPLERLIELREQSTELGQAIDAMVTNTVGFGWTLRERPMPEAMRSKLAPAIEMERFALKAWLESVHPTQSFTSLRRETKSDQHGCGNGYLELIEGRDEKPIGINHVRGHLLRLTEKDKKPVKVQVPRLRPDKQFTAERVPMLHRFRRYVMLRYGKPVWFKEAGDPRILDKRTGEFGEAEDIKPGRRATSVIHFGNYSALTPYGLPLWIGNLFSVFGSRQAEEINFGTLSNNAIPSMFVIVENGALTEKSIERLKEWTEEQIQKSVNRSKFILLEGDTLEDGAPSPTQFKIKVEPLKQLQENDELFQKYDANNREKVRQAFRLPPIFVGRAEEYNRACYSADTETLTENGWKLFCEVERSERIATLNPDTCGVEYHEPLDWLHAYDYEGEMYRFQNRNTDILVTPDHDMWFSTTRCGSYQKAHAEDIDSNRFFFRSAPESYQPIDAPDYFEVPEMVLEDGPNAGVRPAVRIPIKLWIEFVSAFVADGATTPEFVRGQLRHMYNVQFGVHKPHKVDLLTRLYNELAVLGFRVFNMSVDASGKHNFVLADKVLWKLLRQTCGTKAHEKQLPQEMVHYPKWLLEAALKVLIATDGTRDGRKGRTNCSYSTTSRVLADQVQILALHLGNRAHVISTPAKGNKRECHRVLITPERKEHQVNQSDISIEPYSGKVYCFNVPGHLFFTRRNGRVAVQGNTADTSRDVADEQVFGPERAEDDFLINRFVLLPLGARFHTFRSNHPNITDDIELIRLMGISEKSGAMTPKRADRIIRDVFGDDIGPMPEGINLNQPYSLTFAQAQQGLLGGAGGGGSLPGSSDPASRMVDSLLTLRKRIEDELDRRDDEEGTEDDSWL